MSLDPNLPSCYAAIALEAVFKVKPVSAVMSQLMCYTGVRHAWTRLWANACTAKTLLLQAGVESNPGPTVSLQGMQSCSIMCPDNIRPYQSFPLNLCRMSCWADAADGWARHAALSF